VSLGLEILCPLLLFFGSFFLVVFIFKHLSDTFLKWMKDLD